MIDKSMPANGAMTGGMYQTQATDIINDMQPEIEIEIEGDEGMVVEIEDDEIEDEHDANLLETLFSTPEKRSEINARVTEWVGAYDEDVRSRDGWEKMYVEGLKHLGLTIEEKTQPFAGACGVVHPLLVEAVVRFQSEAITESFPATGPVKTQIIGKQTPDRLAAAERVKEDMNWRLTDEMPEYRVEHERLLWNLAISGSAFKKVYFDASLNRQASMFVPADDLIVNYGAADIHTAERVTHVMRRTKNWIQRMIDAGVYVDEEVGEAENKRTEIQLAKDKLLGIDGANGDLYTVLEMLVDLDIEHPKEGEDEQEYAWPYVVTINTATNRVMSIRRNWKKGDEAKKKLQHFVHYMYIPGFGFYGFGLVHLVGGHAKAGTSLLRQLVDAGTLANLPGGFKTRGFRIKNDDVPIKPGEFKDVDIPSGSLRDNILPLPYKEPSATLYNLLNTLVEDGRKTANISDAAFSDANQNAPVGTTLALIERQLKTLSAVQARMHAAMRIEFKLLKELIKNNGERQYPYDADPDRKTKDEDYSIIEILPVSDPNATTMGVRIAQFQAAFELSAKAPQLYDAAYLHREMLQTIGLKNVDKIVPTPQDQKPRDPVSENMAILMAKPVRAFMQQDHQAHIMAHQAFMNDPKIGMLLGQNPNAQMMFNAMQAHIAEHAAYAYRDQMQKIMGVALPDPNAELDPQAEYELASLLAQAAQQALAQNTNEQAQAQAQAAAQDPLVQMQQAELQLKDREVKVKERAQQLEEAIAAAEGKLTPQQGDPVKQVEASAKMKEIERADLQTQQKMRHAEQNHQVQLNSNIRRDSVQNRQAQESHGLQQMIAARKAKQDMELREKAAALAAKNKPTPGDKK